MAYYDDWPVLGIEDVNPRQQRLFEQYEDYLLRYIKERYDSRGRYWNRDFAGLDAYEASVEPNRQHFLDSLGGWPWDRQALHMRIEPLETTLDFRSERVYYRVFDNVESDAILLTPHGKGPFPGLVLQIGIYGVPETACGFTADEHAGKDSTYHRIGGRLARHGYTVLATRMVTGFEPETLAGRFAPKLQELKSAQPHARMYLNRLCRTIGMDLFGVEMFALSRGVDLLESLPQVASDRIGFYGKSQGGQSGLWLGALDTRLQAVVSTAWFNERFQKQVIPSEIYRAFAFTAEEDKMYAHLHEFADSDIASLICPRAFMVEEGKHDGAVYWKLAEQAFAEVKAIYERLGIGEKCDIHVHEGGHEIEPGEDTAQLHSVQFLDRWLKS